MAFVAYALTALTAVGSLGLLIAHLGKMGARRINGLNDPTTARRFFTLLLNQAKEKMIVYDDGSNVADSIYTDPHVIDAIEAKLHGTPGFRIECLFNCPVPTPLLERFGDHDRVEMKTTGLGEKAPRDTHLKIIDGGRMAYLTQHEYDSLTRAYELVDCLTVWRLKRVARKELGGIMDLFDARFRQAA